MPRKPKPLTDSQRVKAEQYRTASEHATLRSRQREAEIRRIVQAEAEADNLAAWKLAWELMQAGASPTLVANIAGLSRTSIYMQAKRYQEYMDERGIAPEAEEARSPWTFKRNPADYDSFLVTHPELGLFHAVFEEDDSLTIWPDGGTYRPINREDPSLNVSGEWTAEHELMNAPLREFAKGEPDPVEAANEPVDAVAPEAVDALSFLDAEDEL